MIIIALGSNLAGPWGAPVQTVSRALDELNKGPSRVIKASSLMLTKPMGPKNQPDYVNAVAQITTHLPPDTLLRLLHGIERLAGRSRRRRWGARTLDLDLIAYHNVVRKRSGIALKPLALPHPGLHEREFVLRPLHEIAPNWKHPILQRNPRQLLITLFRH